MRSLAVLLVMSMLLGSCASIIHGTTDVISVRSNEKDTTLFLNGSEIGKDSATVTVAKDKLSSSVIRASKRGCRDATERIDTKFDPTTLWGILIDYGIISILVIDMAINGATSRAAQTDYVVTPQCT